MLPAVKRILRRDINAALTTAITAENEANSVWRTADRKDVDAALHVFQKLQEVRKTLLQTLIEFEQIPEDKHYA